MNDQFRYTKCKFKLRDIGIKKLYIQYFFLSLVKLTSIDLISQYFCMSNVNEFIRASALKDPVK